MEKKGFDVRSLTWVNSIHIKAYFLGGIICSNLQSSANAEGITWRGHGHQHELFLPNERA